MLRTGDGEDEVSIGDAGEHVRVNILPHATWLLHVTDSTMGRREVVGSRTRQGASCASAMKTVVLSSSLLSHGPQLSAARSSTSSRPTLRPTAAPPTHSACPVRPAGFLGRTKSWCGCG